MPSRAATAISAARAGAVVDFHRNAKALPRNGGAIDAFGAGLGEDLAGKGGHESAVKAAIGGHQIGMRHRRLEKPAPRRRAFLADALARDQPGITRGERAQRHCVGGNGAAVDARRRIVQRDPQHALQGLFHLDLDAVLGALVACRRRSLVAGQAEKPSVLPRAVVVQGGRLLPRPGQRARARLVRGPMNAARQRADIEPHLRQHPCGQRGVARLPAVGSAAKRQLFVGEA